MSDWAPRSENTKDSAPPSQSHDGSEVEHEAFRIGEVAEVRRIRPAIELRSPVEILPVKPRDRVIRIHEYQRDPTPKEVSANRASKAHKLLNTSAVDKFGRRHGNQLPRRPVARTEYERVALPSRLADHADASVTHVIAHEVALERSEAVALSSLRREHADLHLLGAGRQRRDGGKDPRASALVPLGFQNPPGVRSWCDVQECHVASRQDTRCQERGI